MTTGRHFPNSTGGVQTLMLSLSFSIVSWSVVNAYIFICRNPPYPETFLRSCPQFKAVRSFLNIMLLTVPSDGPK